MAWLLSIAVLNSMLQKCHRDRPLLFWLGRGGEFGSIVHSMMGVDVRFVSPIGGGLVRFEFSLHRQYLVRLRFAFIVIFVAF
jgi:hypothetical protein